MGGDGQRGEVSGGTIFQGDASRKTPFSVVWLINADELAPGAFQLARSFSQGRFARKAYRL